MTVANYANLSDSIFTFTTPSEIEELAAHALNGKLKAISNNSFDKWFGYHISTCEEPSILGASLHGLYIGKKS
ncbi:hypothetical protein [Clostridium sp. E02]|uniref:hypothetical protein n=1 Tax=Clostridium sp. E02 TaxID=2487134 RepID=UPI000F53A2C4|nr:hypothetical protein [Clostridium sp. E02]